jgi:hypothetical protein
VDQGYGLVCDLAGRPLADCILVGANQEHGIMARRPGSAPDTPSCRWASRCASCPTTPVPPRRNTGAYQVVGEDGAVTATWQRFSGW